MEVWSALQKQNDADIVYNHKRYTSDMVLGPKRRGLSVTYCTDTRPVPGLVPFAKGSNLFICEGMHGNDDEKCAQHMHMSFAEAAEIAKKAEVGELWLTHFSPALLNPAEYLPAAAAIFPHTVIGRDRMKKTLRYIED
jgi:ribonuclease Z